MLPKHGRARTGCAACRRHKTFKTFLPVCVQKRAGNYSASDLQFNLLDDSFRSPSSYRRSRTRVSLGASENPVVGGRTAAAAGENAGASQRDLKRSATPTAGR